MANPQTSAPRPASLLKLIAAFKLFKALIAGLLAVLAFHLLQPDFAAAVGAWLESLHWLTRYGLVVRLIDQVLGLDPHRFRLFGLVATAYCVLYLVQGVGLWRGRRWAEYLVVVEGALLLPLELWELWHRFSAFKLGVLLANLAIVAYLLQVLRRSRTR